MNRHKAGPTVRRLTHHERVEWHDHAEHQLIYPGTGVLRVTTGAGAWVVPPLRAIWLPAEVAHTHRAQGPTDMHTLGFPATADPFGHRDPVVVNVPGLLREIILALTGEPALSGPDRDDLSRVLLRSLAPVPSVHLHLPYPADDRLARVAGALTDDPGDARSLGELGAAAGASERTLSRLFRQQTGMTFPQWRAQLRLQHGLTLLAAGQPVTAVAHGCGYGSPSAFTAAFRDAFGMTPSDAFGRVTTSGRG